jgi:hypothetical protein
MTAATIENRAEKTALPPGILAAVAACDFAELELTDDQADALAHLAAISNYGIDIELIDARTAAIAGLMESHVGEAVIPIAAAFDQELAMLNAWRKGVGDALQPRLLRNFVQAILYDVTPEQGQEIEQELRGLRYPVHLD